MLKSYYGIKLLRTPYKLPHKNGVIERFHLSLKSEAFDNIVPINLLHAQKVCREYQDYYNKYRTHQGLDGKVPAGESLGSQNIIGFTRKKHMGGRFMSFEPQYFHVY